MKAVLFDMDGVLVHTYEAWFGLMARATSELGYPVVTREQFHASWGQGLAADVERFFPRHDLPTVERYYAENFHRHAAGVRVDPDAARVLRGLAERGIGRAVITNTPAVLAREILKAAALEPDALVGGTDVPRAKPHPDMVHEACRRLGVGEADALVVGDSRYDLEAARAAGVRFAGYGIDGDFRLASLGDLLTR